MRTDYLEATAQSLGLVEDEPDPQQAIIQALGIIALNLAALSDEIQAWRETK